MTVPLLDLPAFHDDYVAMRQGKFEERNQVCLLALVLVSEVVGQVRLDSLSLGTPRHCSGTAERQRCYDRAQS